MNSKANSILVGFDVGSTTVKAVAMDQRGEEVLWRDYQRHGTNQAGRVLEFLTRLEDEVAISSSNSRIFFTGSGAGSVAGLVGARFVQEVHAVALAVEKYHPDTRSVIELGGQDAKVIIFKENPGSRRKRKFSSMNDKCAGGTGAVVDRIASKLRLSSKQLRAIRYRGARIHSVAAKCGVFAETDINNLRVRGASVEEMMASLFEAIVTQNLTVLTRGHTLHPEVLLLGGPHTFLRGLVEAWQENLPQMWEERGVEVPAVRKVQELIRAPKDSQYFGALGAIEFGKTEQTDSGHYRGTDELKRYMERDHRPIRGRTDARALSGPKEELDEFLAQYRPKHFRPCDFESGERVEGFLGIDGGSTTTKAVLLSKRGEVMAKAYKVSDGNPIQDMIEVVGELEKQLTSRGVDLGVLGVGTTGYAKDIFKEIISADVALVETIAHAKSAMKFYRDVDVIVDVGGQDIKLIVLSDGHVKDFMLNSQCSAGNGYYLQNTVESFGYSVEEYADLAFSAGAMPQFGYGCAVFMQADIVSFQRQGWSSAEILAGLASVLPKNIWLYVARIPNLPDLGKRFVLQGGTQRNLAAVKAQVDYIRESFQEVGRESDIIVHEHCGEAGAIGAALEAAHYWQGGRKTSFIGLDKVRQIQYTSTCNEETRCFYCKNRCLRTLLDISMPLAVGSDRQVSDQLTGRRLILAGCEKGSAESVDEMREIKARIDSVREANPNLAEIACREVWKSRGVEQVADPIPGRRWTRKVRRRAALMSKRSEIRIGIPRVLTFFQNAPLFTAYLQSLGIGERNIVFSDWTSEKLYREGAKRGSIDPCYPAKLCIAHVHNLLYKKNDRKSLDYVFFPMVSEVRSPLSHLAGNDACCNVSASPESVKAAFTKEVDVFEQRGIEYVEPLLSLHDRKMFSQAMFGAWGSHLGLSREEHERAVGEAYKAQENFEREMQRRSRVILEMLEREQRIGILVLGRSYHHDPGLNHEILDRMQELGYPILTQSTLPLDEDLLDRLFGEEVRLGRIRDPLDISDVWGNTYAANSCLKIWAAKFAARHPNLVALEISSFNCGHDAPIYSVCEAIVEAAGTPFFSFRELDENRPSGTFKIRIETIDYFLKRYRKKLMDDSKSQGQIELQLADYERQLRQRLRAIAS